MFSWRAYRRNVPRFGIARLIFFVAVTALFLALPLLSGAVHFPSTLLALLGLCPLLFRSVLTSVPERMMLILRIDAVLIGLTTLAVGQFDIGPWGVGAVAFLSVGWAATWFVLVSDDQIEAQKT